MSNQTYECPICYAVNSQHKQQCSACGTIPGHWSVIKKPSRLLSEDTGDCLNGLIEVVSAIGVDRIERHRYARVNLRTVPADYYAEKE